MQKHTDLNFWKNHPDYGKTLNNIGSSLYKVGLYQQALKYFEQALQILKNSLGEKDPQYLNVVENIRKTKQQLSNQNKNQKWEKENIQNSNIQIIHLESLKTPFKDYVEICMFAIFQALDIDLMKKQFLDKNQYDQIMVQMNQEKKELAKIIFQRIKLKQKVDLSLHTPENSASLQILNSLNNLIRCMLDVCDQIPNSVQQFKSAEIQFKKIKEEISWMIYDQFY